MAIENIQYTDTECMIIVITNIFKMLENRKLLNRDKFITDASLKDIYTNLIVKQYYQFNTQVKDKNGRNKYMIVYIDEEFDKISKNTKLYNYISKYPEYHQIFILKNINNNIVEQAKTQYDNIELFKKNNFMIDIVSHVMVPEHILITDKEEIETICKDYNSTLDKFPKILLTDPVARYYNADINDLFKIKRYSPTSGISISYRAVIN